MAHEGLFATSAECIFKMGKNYDSTNVIEARINELCLQAESLINVAAKYNFTGTYTAGAPPTTTLSASVKSFLAELASNLVAIYAITEDMSGFTTRTEAEDMINVLRDAILRGLSLLRNKDIVDWMVAV